MSIHIIGAGLAGLAAAVRLTRMGQHVIIHEGTKAAGGRARSYVDPQLGHLIDNGNHLLLSGNHATMEYLTIIGAADTLTGPVEPIFPFIDLATNKHWTLRLNKGRLPLWIFFKSRRVPDTSPLDYLALLKLRSAQPKDLMLDLVNRTNPLYKNFLEALTISALNTMPEVASATPMRAVIAETIERGGKFTIPRFAKIGLSESFIDPALAWLKKAGAEFHFNSRITSLDPKQKTILAVPPWIAPTLVPGLITPEEFESICNLHFVHTLPPGEAGFWGLTRGIAEWVFAKGRITSVTISAANRYATMDNADIAAKVWNELSRAFSLPTQLPPHRVLWERRATFACTPETLARRPQTRTTNPNLALAGDYTATRLPSTIEGAIRSGNKAADEIMR